ncbi:carbon-nitrogen hydrolase family protein [Geopsychrobacter electrodiphilus]|uniref:carbon-nitrogen hydrolase family protein n=1 Tax=Geopsychrobacter electrodiphilus TaxID=225196 RepID=UPI0003748589|nr:carbon-nitrogen hydrolase family protein [Geopsychrobacter electrodiphilus]
MEVRSGDNLEAMKAQLERTMARYPWVQMVLFGELCAFGPDIARAQPMPGAAEQYFCALAQEYGIWLIPGSFNELSGDIVYNTAPVISPAGAVVTRHRKIYPFLPYEKGIAGGTECTVFDIPEVGRFGLSICYDMWFPETTRSMVAMGAEVILHPTMTNTSDRELELSIARTSAAVNQCYFCDVNNVGELGYGRSVIVGPEGDVIYQAQSGPETIVFEIDLKRVRRVRERGLLGLGQPLKSFRDALVRYPIYTQNAATDCALKNLGPLELPRRERK